MSLQGSVLATNEVFVSLLSILKLFKERTFAFPIAIVSIPYRAGPVLKGTGTLFLHYRRVNRFLKSRRRKSELVMFAYTNE